VGLVDRDVILLLHALDQLLDQFIQLSLGHHLLDLLAQILVEHLTIQQRLLDGALEVIEGVLSLRHFVPHGILEPALQQVIRERAEQILHAHLARRIGHVFGITDALHKKVVSRSWSAISWVAILLTTDH
jgi:hypothetical protein